ncbi:MAG: dephospho-CoA kinase, partial [Intestinibacillus sp.]
LVYPYIRDASLAAFARLEAQDCALALFDAPTLIESGLHRLCRAQNTGAGVLGMLAPVDVRIRRVMARDGLTEQAARARIAAQPPDGFYRAHCDYLIQNDDGLDELQPLVERFWETLHRLPLAPQPRGLVFARQNEPV